MEIDMKIRKARSFMPFDNRGDSSGQASISPLTNRSIMPFNNVYTIQDIVFDGRKYVLPGMGGEWGDGEDAQPGSYKSQGSDYKLKEQYLSQLREQRDYAIRNQLSDSSGLVNPINAAPSMEIWRVSLPGGSRDFPSFQQAQLYKEKLRQKRNVTDTYVSRVAQSVNKGEVVTKALDQCLMVESVDVAAGLKENGASFCVGPNLFITCAHVIKKYDKNNIVGSDAEYLKGATVSLIRGEKLYNAEVVGVNRSWDIALIRSEVDVEPFALSDEIYVGENIITVGSPHGFENNLSVGNVGSLNRQIYSYQGAPDYMFVDLAVHPGNSGGPVIREATGEVIGMVTLIVSETGTYGLNAALPSSYIRSFIESSS